MTKKIGVVATILAALSAISLSPYRFALKSEMDAVAAQVQTLECRDMQYQLNDAYARRDSYIQRGEVIPQWLQQQIADYEVYIRQFC
tara:strand:- start:19124 stop:19384 length:261 start_codon:yes stop_codon:yes gene_type:complete